VVYFVSYFGTAKEMDLWRIASTGGAPERLTLAATRHCKFSARKRAHRQPLPNGSFN